MIKLLKLLMGNDSINCAVAAAASVSSVHKHHVQSLLKRLTCLIPLDNNCCGLILIVLLLLLLLFVIVA